MIKLERERTAKAITTALRGKSRVEKALILLAGTRDKNLKFTSANSHWKKAKQQLKVESHGKCAYCEAPTDAVAHGDVEHFRPKSVYWWLAYCYDNYLYSCQICNQSFKSDNFPTHGTPLELVPPFPDPFPSNLTDADLQKMAAMFAPDPLNDAEGFPMADFTRAVLKEKAGLIDPYLINPEPLFKWVAEPVQKEVYMRARDNKAATERAFAAVDEFLGLNRVELVRIRWTIYEPLETFKETLLSGQIQEPLLGRIKQQMREMTSANAPFAGMARYFVNEEWKLDLT